MTTEKIQEAAPTNIGYWEQVLRAPTPAYQELFEAEQKYIFENIQSSDKVLDIGSGEGRNMKSILKKTPNVVGVDNDAAAVSQAKENFKDISTVELVQSDATKLPFEEGVFDVVTFLMILPNMDRNKADAIQEAARVLKKDGFLIISTFSETAFEERMKVYRQVNAPIKEIQGTKVVFDESLGANVSEQFSKEELEKLGTEAGLTMVDCQKVGMLAYICKFKK